MRILVRAKAIVTPLCQHSRHQYRSKNRCGLSCRPLIKDSTSARMNSAPFELQRRNRYYNKRSFCQMARARYRKRDSPSLSSSLLLLSFLSNMLVLFDRPQSFPSGWAVVNGPHAFTFYRAYVFTSIDMTS